MLVMKFGGTSVECAESILRAAKIVRDRLPLRPVVVVSALAGVTDQLHAMGNLSREGQREQALARLAAVEQRHYEVAEKLLSSAARDFIESSLRVSFEEAHALLKAISALGELTPRTLDRLLSFGERWSSCLVSEGFRAHGLPAVFIDACDVLITDSNHSHASPLMDEVSVLARAKISPLLDGESIPVLGGFIGATRDGVPTTLGRGGSDFTASIIGGCLRAERIEIWTDVDGMMTADPRICPDAQNIDSISFEEAAELAHFGAKVLHPKTLQPAVERGIPVYVLNSQHPENCGTRVESEPADKGSRVRSIACKRGIVLAEIVAKPGREAKVTASVFTALEEHKSLVDLAALSRSNVSLLLASRDSASRLAAALDGAATVKITPAVSLVSLVGRSVARDPAILSRALAALPEQTVKMIFHGASEMNLSFVIDEQAADDVVRSLHRELFPLQSIQTRPSLPLEFLPAQNARFDNPITAGEA